MIILGIDPGIASTGYGILEFTNSRFKVKEYGCIKTKPNLSIEKRLQKIYTKINELITEHQPQQLVIEELFMGANTKTAIVVGQARGVALLAAANHDLEAFEYTPLQVKQAVSGYGRAEKEQIQYMIKLILELSKEPKPDDAADALALAVCHAHSHKLKMIVEADKSG